jgi:chloramphenicol-sensitive protein RarD
MKKSGMAFAIGAYILWGLFPIYWKWLRHVSATQVIGHRITWSFIMVLVFILATRQFNKFYRVAFTWRSLWVYSLASGLIGTNWLVYVWAVNSDLIIEASLGYFIFPLLSIVLGVVFLHEHLRPFQWFSIGIAAIGVFYLSIIYGRLPWIALTLASTFGIYGLVKKLAPLNSLFGLAVETGILFIPSVVYLFYMDASGGGWFLRGNIITNFLLVGAGAITTIPLLLFSSAAKILPLSMIGILQYIAPTIAFLLGVLVYKETFDIAQLIGFGFVWLALALFAADGLWVRRTMPKVLK